MMYDACCISVWNGMGWDDVGWGGMGWAFDIRFSCKIMFVFQKSRFFLLPSDPRPLDSKNVPDKISFLPRDRNNCLKKLGFPFPNRNIPVQSPHRRTAEEEEAQGQEEEEA